MRALVGPDPTGAVILHAYAREEPAPRAALPVGSGVVLLERPQLRLLVLNHDVVATPVRERAGGLGVWIIAPREVDAHDVVRGASLELGPLLIVDHVIRRRDDGLQAAGLLEVVVKGSERLDLRHRGG